MATRKPPAPASKGSRPDGDPGYTPIGRGSKFEHDRRAANEAARGSDPTSRPVGEHAGAPVMVTLVKPPPKR